MTTHFIITAILVEADQESFLRSSVEAVRAKHFGAGEMKSSGVSRDHERRRKILNDLADLPFRFVSLVVDKRAIWKDSGLIYKQPFQKYLHKRLFDRLFAGEPGLVMTADEHGRPKFMDEFCEYVRKNVAPHLFERPKFKFENSKSEVLLQLADFVSGTLARVFDPKKSVAATEPFVRPLQEHALAVDTWPYVLRPDVAMGGAKDPNDRRVREYCLIQLQRFLAEQESAGGGLFAPAVIANHLLFHFNAVSEHEYVSTGRLRDVLVEQRVSGFEEEQQFRAGVIAHLRDRGVILASSPKGYKIPASVSDLMDFVARTDSVVRPMIRRLGKARSDIMIATHGRVDITGGEGLDYLRRVLTDLAPAEESDSKDDPTSN